MGTLAIGYDITVRSALAGQTLINTFAYGNANVPDVESQGHMAAVAARVQAIVNEFKKLQTTVVQYLTYEIRAVYDSLAAYSAGGLSGAGEYVQDTLPPQAVVSVRLNRISLGVRHGWNRWSGIPEGVTDAGSLTVLHATAWQSAYAAVALLPLDLGGVSLTYGYIYSSFNGQKLLSPQFIECSGVSVNTSVGSQNSRKLGRGM